MNSLSLLNTTPLYIAILGLLFIPITMRVGFYRLKSKIYIGTGEDPEMLRRMRGQANFIETVPMALFLLVTMELLGAPHLWLHALCGALVFGRAAHYLGLTELGPGGLRPLGMVLTLLTVLISSCWILFRVL